MYIWFLCTNNTECLIQCTYNMQCLIECTYNMESLLEYTALSISTPSQHLQYRLKIKSLCTNNTVSLLECTHTIESLSPLCTNNLLECTYTIESLCTPTISSQSLPLQYRGKIQSLCTTNIESLLELYLQYNMYMISLHQQYRVSPRTYL